MKKILLIAALYITFSCQKEKPNPFLGSWYFDQIVDNDTIKSKYPNYLIEHRFSSNYNFEIVNDSIFDFKDGFYYYIANKRWNENDDAKPMRSSYYLGSKTNYKVHDSNLIYYNKASKDWDTMKIHKIWNDTMIVQGHEQALYQLVRKQNNFFDDKSYDAITIDRSPCFGSCPFNATYIDRKGNFFFKPYQHNTAYLNVQAQLDPETIAYYFNLFDKIPISKLEDHYTFSATDSQNNTVSFFKEGKIVKTISCYIENPIDLKKAYSELSFAYQNVKVEDDPYFIFDNYVSLHTFSTGKLDFRLKESEGFFLEIALRLGKEVQTAFKPLYELKFSLLGKKSDVKKITTDGRFYRIEMNDGTSKTLDIGYHFIEKNPLIKKNRIF